ncbi:MAG: hypothetical protein ACJ8F3_18435 [Xanthobacteraceae bacterium]
MMRSLNRKTHARHPSAGMVRTFMILSVLSASALSGTAPASAQDAADVAYVDLVSGPVIALVNGTPKLLEPLDTIHAGTRIDLPPKTELRICHYTTRRYFSLKGPARANISSAGLIAEAGKLTEVPPPACVAPVVSNFQGGLVVRSVWLVDVPLRPRFKVINQGRIPIEKIALWDETREAMVGTADPGARPNLEDGRIYRLAVKRSDGSELKVLLRGDARIPTGPTILVMR